MVRAIRHETNHAGKTIAWIVGIGYMGRPIARVLESGFKLTAYDRDHSKAEG